MKKGQAKKMMAAVDKAAKKMKGAGKSERYGVVHGANCPPITSAGGPRHDGRTKKENDRAYGRGEKR